MATRKRWEAKTEITPDLLKFREKRKWQINLRRYVIEKSPCPAYAPYFGLDIENMRKWFEIQFEPGVSWEDFAKKWQFEHIIPVTHFDLTADAELKLCWNFTNMRADPIQVDKAPANRIDLVAAKAYFHNLYQKTLYGPCQKLVEKIEKIEQTAIASSEPQLSFILKNQNYLKSIEGYSAFEFEFLNRGKSIEDVQKEMGFLKNPRG